MALPAHLQRYDSLIDLVVEQLVREIEAAAQSPGARESAPRDLPLVAPTTQPTVPHVI